MLTEKIRPCRFTVALAGRKMGQKGSVSSW